MNPDLFSRNLKKGDLGGVIFGCKKHMMKECLSKQLFGLPASHFSYVRNIQTGLPLFLFNYGDRSLHGIYEAASSGQMNIDPYAWTNDGLEKTKYPAQVRICVRHECHPILENEFRNILNESYCSPTQFCFELDHAQVDALILLFMKYATRRSILPAILPRNTYQWTNGLKDNISLGDKSNPELTAINAVVVSSFSKVEETSSGWKNWMNNEWSCSDNLYECDSKHHVSVYDLSADDSASVKSSSANTRCSNNEKQAIDNEFDSRTKEKDEDVILNKLKQLVNNHCSISSGNLKNDSGAFLAKNIVHQVDEYAPGTKELSGKSERALSTSEFNHDMTQLKEDFQMLRRLAVDQGQQISILEQKQVQSEMEILQLKKRVMELETQLVMTTENVDNQPLDLSDDKITLDIREAMYLVGGFDGISWLSRLDLYEPKCGSVLPLQSMSSPRSYADVASLHGCIYAIGGGDGCSWYDTVECYNPCSKEWSKCPSLTCEKGCLSAVTLEDKIFVLGGSNGTDFFSDVEMYDPILGKWIVVGCMRHKRASHAAAEIGGAIYVVGGYDGKEYLQSAERYDPREVSWARLDCMSSRRGCLSLVVLNERLYALGGYDGTNFLSSVEMFDPRLGSWVVADPMNSFRGCASAVTLGDSVHIIGGFKNEAKEIADTVEYFREGVGWQITNSKSVGRRCLHSAAVL